MRSIRSISRGRTEQGFALISALVLAILYIALMELMLIDSTRSLQEAQRFRSHVIAGTLAENAAELAAENLVLTLARTVDTTNQQGAMTGSMKRTGASQFVITGSGTDGGMLPSTATVELDGSVSGMDIHIQWSRHSQ